MPAQFTIMTTPHAHAAISPSGDVEVDAGADQSFAITADPGYHVADVVVDGDSVGAVATYDFHDVTANHQIEATAAADAVTHMSGGAVYWLTKLKARGQ